MRHVLVICLIGLFGSACGSSEIETASAGSNRSEPARFSDAADVAGASDSAQSPDGATEDSPAPPDRILREGSQGTVTRIIDGDTVHVTVDGWYHRVRIQGINAPECENEASDGGGFICVRDAEWWGYMAYQAMIEIAEGESVTVRCDEAESMPCPQDEFERYLAFLDSESGDLGEQLVRAGGAMSFTKFESSRRARYCQAEDAALTDEVGMWTLGDRDAVLSRMNESTRSWYDERDERCRQALDE